MPLLYKLKYGVKFFIANLLYYSGLLSLLLSKKLKDKAVVLMYHRVLDEQEQEETYSHPGIITDKGVFAKQMAFLKKQFNVLSEDEFLACVSEGEPFKEKSCFITFDDGWVDNYTNAYPILLQLKLPATIFLATSYVGTKNVFWQEELAAGLFRFYQNGDFCALASLREEGLSDLSKVLPGEAKVKIRKFVSQVKGYSAADRESLLSRLFLDQKLEEEKKNNHIDAFMTWLQVVEMSKNGISFGSHSEKHHILTTIPIANVEEEVTVSRDTITRHLGKAPRTFCYPNGDYSEDIAKEVKTAGYKAAFITEPGYIDSENNIYSLHRMNAHTNATKNIPLFMSRILGLF